MNNKDFEPIRVRIMQEAYELADRNDSEGYNAIKVMCGDVQRMLPPQPAQEPVLVVEKEPDYMSRGHFYTGSKPHIDPTKIWSLPIGTKLYTTPPQRPWVGLTEGEWFKCWLILQAVDETEAEFDFADFLIIAQAVVANLKGKNT